MWDENCEYGTGDELESGNGGEKGNKEGGVEKGGDERGG